MYNSYGGQFQGLHKPAAKPTPASPPKASGGSKASGEKAPADKDGVPTKVIIDLKSLKSVEMPEITDPNRRDFFVAAIFEQDDLNDVMKHKRARSSIVRGVFENGKWTSKFDCKLVLPINDPSKRLRFYICAITATHTEEDGKRARDIALLGIGHTDSFFMDKCQTYPVKEMELKKVEGGDPAINPGILELSVECCMSSQGPAIPEDIQDSVLEVYQEMIQKEA